MPGSPAKDQLPNAALGIGTLDQKVGSELTRLRQNGGSRRATLVLTGQCPGRDTMEPEGRRDLLPTRALNRRPFDCHDNYPASSDQKRHGKRDSTRRLGAAIPGQGDSVLKVGIGVSAIHALGDGRWRPGMSGSDGARGADLWEVFSVVPDHRRAEGKRYPLAGLLMIALAAMLAGRSDQLGIVRWGRKLSRE